MIPEVFESYVKKSQNQIFNKPTVTILVKVNNVNYKYHVDWEKTHKSVP